MFQNRTLLFALFFCFGCSLLGQNRFRIAKDVNIGDTTQLHELILVNYSSLIGNCVAVGRKDVTFQLRDADEPTIIPVEDVRYLDIYFDPDQTFILFDKEKDKLVNIAFSSPTYHRTALPWHGDGQVRITNIAYSVAEFNTGKNFQVGIGTTLFFGVLTTQNLRFSAGDDFHFGIAHQALYPLLFTDIGPAPLVGDLSANLTFGNSDRWLNLGGGFLYATDDELRPTHLNLSAGGRLGRNWHFYGEVSVIDDRFDVIILPSFSAAHTVRRHRWRYGFFNVLSPIDGPLVPFPLIGYEYHW